MRLSTTTIFALLTLLPLTTSSSSSSSSSTPPPPSPSIPPSSNPPLPPHTSNWAVLISTSRFWFNYRHLANVLSLYRTVKRLGIPDSQILLLLPDDMACNPRNAFPGTVYNNAARALDLYGSNIEVDYRGYEVTVETFIRLLTDRWGAEVPRGKRLGSDRGSNLLVYMTGHGGNEFLKFQDSEEVGAWDLADAVGQMWAKGRYRELLFMIDTCQANTMFSRFYSPNIIATGSSAVDQSSYSHHADNDVGVAVIDRYTYYNLDFLETRVTGPGSKLTLGELFDSYDEAKIHSQPGVRWDLFPGGEEEGRGRRVMDFFGNVQGVEVGEGMGMGGLGNESEWREDLRRLGELVRQQQQQRRRRMGGGDGVRSEEETQKETGKIVDRAQAMVRAAKVESGEGWGQRAMGLAAVLGCGLLWSGAAWLDGSK